jgi:hypothetical protein
MAKATAPKELTTAEDVELEYRRLQVEELRQTLSDRAERKERLRAERLAQVEDFKRSERQRLHNQRVCKHRKGGRDNKFANGNAPDYSIILNTYPTGAMIFMCTRCGKEVPKPDAKLKKTDPKLYAEMWETWKLWASYPTDNTPSGGKIFEILEEAA